MNKYQNGKIYKLVCDNSPLVYYGSTIETLSTRLSKHKYRKNCGCKELFELGKVSIHLVKKFPCNSEIELENEERLFIEVFLRCFPFKIICNKRIPLRKFKEWRPNNEEILLQQNK